MSHKLATIVVVACLVVGATGVDRDAEAGGIILYELGTPDVGRASAGWAARAGDAATVFTNPAGMSRLPGNDLLVGGQLTYGQFGFKPNENTPSGGSPVPAYSTPTNLGLAGTPESAPSLTSGWPRNTTRVGLDGTMSRSPL